MTDSQLIAIEGIDGSGTTTVVDSLTENPDIVTTSEPAEQYWTGEAARQAINDDEAPAMTDLFFFLGDRAYHIENTIEPMLAKGYHVVSDRYLMSTYAYQQENIRPIVDVNPVAFIEEMMYDWVREPDLTILLDLPADVAAERRADEGDKYEVSGFQKQVRRNYLKLANADENAVVVDATQEKWEVIKEVKDILVEEL